MAEEAGGTARIGLYGAAFNPPHLGHDAVLRAARDQLSPDRIIIVPTGRPYHKEVERDPGREVRFKLARAAFSGFDRLELSRAELDRDGPSYTCETLEEIEDLFPDSEICLLMGADSAVGLSDWNRPERLIELATVTVAPRKGVDPDEVKRAIAGLGAEDAVRFLEMPEVAISSSQVRDRIAAGKPFRHLVPGSVAEIIESEGLYGIG